jgi:UDP-N-acetylglucosamine enolpyruvyl transferase
VQLLVGAHRQRVRQELERLLLLLRQVAAAEVGVQGQVRQQGADVGGADLRGAAAAYVTSLSTLGI